LFNLLEEQCHNLDIKVQHDSDGNDGGSTYQRYVTAFQEHQKVEEELKR